MHLAISFSPSWPPPHGDHEIIQRSVMANQTVTTDDNRMAPQSQPLSPSNHFTTKLTLPFIIITISIAVTTSFLAGHAARQYILRQFLQIYSIKTAAIHTSSSLTTSVQQTLPRPLLPEGKELPQTTYTSKTFDTSASATHTSLLIQKANPLDSVPPPTCASNDAAGGTCRLSPPLEDDENYLPQGQHLLVDLKNVSPAFLNSEHRLAHAMVSLITRSRLTLLSYHCHTLLPEGVSCAGVLLESHVTFHTWPAEGVITLDLFTCGGNPLMPVLPEMVELFGVTPEPGEGGGMVGEEVEVIWAHKYRGFREVKDHLHGDLDLGGVIGNMAYDYKEEVASIETSIERLDILAVIDPSIQSLHSYQQSLSDTTNTTYESTHPELFQPDTLLFRDGTLFSSRRTATAHYESFVHPGMLAHPSLSSNLTTPRKVGIVGGEDGGALAEVTKYRSVKNVVVLSDVERTVWDFYRRNWDLAGEDVWKSEGVSVHFGEVRQWFLSMFGGEEATVVEEEDKFDILFLDDFRLMEGKGFAETLLRDPPALKALNNSLSDDGILVFPLGQAPGSKDLMEEVTNFIHTEVLNLLKNELKLKRIHFYEESHGTLSTPHSFILGCRTTNCDLNWYTTPPEIELTLHKTLTRPLRYIDGAKLTSYRVPHKVYENWFCSSEPLPYECTLIAAHLDMVNYPQETFEVKQSSVETGGRGVFAKANMPKGSVILKEMAHLAVYFSARNHAILRNMFDVPDARDVRDVYKYMSGYGYEGEDLGGTDTGLNSNFLKEYFVDGSLNTYVNHGCNGTFNIGGVSEYYCMNMPDCVFLTEQMSPEELRRYQLIISFNAPVYRRHRQKFLTGFDVTVKDVKAGDEIFTNYLYFEQNPVDLVDYADDMREMCSGAKVGEVSYYEEIDDDDVDFVYRTTSFVQP